MKKTLLATLFLCAILLQAKSPENGLLLHTSFDRFTTEPDYAANPRTATTGIPHELQLRMYNDPSGKLNAVTLNNQEHIEYTHQGNFTPQAGTVSLWVKPINWKMADAHDCQTFFEVRSGDCKYRLIINKAEYGNSVQGILVANGRSHVALTPAKWQTGEWHKLDLVWNAHGMKLHVDGRPPAPGSRGEVVFKEDPRLPTDIRWATMRLNYHQGWKTNPQWNTGYEDLKIYDHMLSSAEILASYERIRPASRSRVQLLMTTPATMPIEATHENDMSVTEAKTTVSARQQDDRLVLDFKVGHPAQKHAINQRDGELWLDDSVEFHLLGRDGEARQFIVNANGAIYDSLQKNPKWDSAAVATAERQTDSWSARLSVPLADLGGGDSFKVNFGVAITDGSHQRFYSWSQRKPNTGFADRRFFGTLRLGTPEQRVSLTTLGNLKSGRLDAVHQVAPGLRATTHYETMSGTSGDAHQATLPEGRATVTFRAVDQNGTPVAVYSRSVIVNPPLVMTAQALPLKHIIQCRLDFSASGLEKGRGRLTLVSEKDGKTYADSTFDAPTPEYTAALPIPEDLPDQTTYRLTASIGQFSTHLPFRVPALAPLRSRIAIDHQVPAPWIPVRVDGQDIRVLDRIYSFSHGPLPARVVSRNAELISRQPQFVLNGMPIRWKPGAIGKNHGDYVELTADGDFDGGAATITGQLWFDGMYRFDLTLAPAAPLRIESLRLVWSTPAEQARYALTPEYTPWQDDRILLRWDPREYNALLWLTGHLSGLAWWCRSDANWIIDPNRYNITVQRRDGQADVAIDMFASPATLKTRASYTMVFQATPPKHPRTDMREMGVGGHWFKECSTVWVGGHSGSKHLAPDNIRNWISLVPIDQRKFRAHMRKMHAQGFKTRLYGMPTHITRLDDEYDWCFKTCALTPAIIWEAVDAQTGHRYVAEPCCANTPIGNLHAYRLDKLYRENPELDGLYFDIMHVRACDNPLHGCGGIDAFGKKYTSSIALNLREYTLRILKIHRRLDRLFAVHAHSAFYPFVHDLADYWMPGEELFKLIERNPQWGYIEEVPPEAYQSAWNAEIHGSVIQFGKQLERIPRILKLPPEKVKIMRSDESAIHAIAVNWLYDFIQPAFGAERQGHPLFKSWGIRRALHMNGARFHAYWLDPATSSAEPAIRVSWFSWSPPAPVPFMLCVVNTCQTPVTTGLAIDWRKLKTPPCRLIDRWSGKTYDENELAKHQLPGHHFMLLTPTTTKGENK